MKQSLRVGTTGDYPPFTLLNSIGQFEGQDIALFKGFAQDHGDEVEWIKTTWPNLSQDLAAGLFEAAIGGISYTQERNEQFLLSSALRADGKVILCHRDFAKLFIDKDIAEFDRPEIRFIYNPGGTNEAIAQAKLEYATLILETEMEAIFKRLVQKEAMAFITDIHEAVYRAEQSQGVLVSVNVDRPLSTTAMVCMFRQDQRGLRKSFNQWLISAGRVYQQPH